MYTHTYMYMCNYMCRCVCIYIYIIHTDMHSELFIVSYSYHLFPDDLFTDFERLFSSQIR